MDDSVASGFTAWPTDPAEKPHGLALAEGDNVLIAGGNGKLVLRNYKTGQFISACDIAQRVDEIAYDPGLGRVYCASGTSVISVAFVGGEHALHARQRHQRTRHPQHRRRSENPRRLDRLRPRHHPLRPVLLREVAFKQENMNG